MAKIPNSFNYIQQVPVQFNNPVSESSIAALGGSINGLLSCLLPVGSTFTSMLTESQLQTEIGSPSPPSWILSDGRDVTGSRYALVTGFTTIPDLRGITVRGKNNGRSDGNQNPDGDLALGTYTVDRFGSHNHGFSDPGHMHNTVYNGLGLPPLLRNNAYASGGGVSETDATGSNAIVTTSSGTGISFSTQGGGDTSPKNITMNWFIRIN